MNMAVKVAYPEWTEYRKKNGLDPLGMQSSSVSLYQDLLPGISNVTLRIRYYGLYAWLSSTYARRIGETSTKRWQRFVRRSEALYALVAQTRGNERGVAGIDWAVSKLATGSDQIEFADDAEPGSPTHYLKQAWGAYGAAYASQLFEIGVFARADEHEIPVPSPEFGDALAETFYGQLGDLADTFFEIVERGSVSRAELETLAPIAPSEIIPESDESRLYTNLLFASGTLQRPTDISRRRTLLLVLAVADHLRRVPDVTDVRWVLYANADPEGRPLVLPAEDLEQHRLRWWVYQANDLVHIAYETLLKRTLDVLEGYPAGVTLPSLIDDVITGLTAVAGEWPKTWTQFVEQTTPAANPASRADPNSEFLLTQAIMQGARPNGSASPETAWSALRLLAVLHNRSRISTKDPAEELGRFDPTGFRSLLTEVRYLERNIDVPFTRMVADLLCQRIIERHLWVAHRKFRYQGDYTFLIETDEGRVRIRASDGPVYTNPRLGPSITFLKDIHLIGNDGLTDLGASVLGAA